MTISKMERRALKRATVALSVSIPRGGRIFNLLGKHMCLLSADILRHFYNWKASIPALRAE